MIGRMPGFAALVPSLLLGLVLSLVPGIATGRNLRAAPPEVIAYTIKPRDTLSDLSRAFLVPERQWRSLLPLSRVRDPLRLPVGRVLRIPRSWLRFTAEPARLASFRGDVAIEVDGARRAPTIGMPVAEGARITTGANSFVTLALADQSRITLPSQSVVRIAALRRIVLTNAIEYRLALEKGRIQNSVTPITSPSGRYRIDTPLTMTAVRGTEFRVSYDAGAKTAATEVLEGKVAVDDLRTHGMALITPGFGTTAGTGQPLASLPLLPAPSLIDPARNQNGDRIVLHLTPVAGASRYRVLLATDAGFVDCFHEAFSAEPMVDLPDIQDGVLFMRLSAIAANGMEGQTQTYAFNRFLASISNGPVEHVQDSYRFRWFGAGAGHRVYRFQLARGAESAVPTVDEVGLESEEISVRRLPAGTYYWRVGMTQSTPQGEVQAWTPFEKLIIDTSVRVK